MKEEIIRNKARSQSILICLFAVLVFAAYNSPARADTTKWIGAGGDWFNAANWDPRVPGPSTDASINNGGNAKIDQSGATAGSLTLGSNLGDSGSVTVDGANGGSLVVAQNCGTGSLGAIYVGSAGRGTLTINHGGIITSGQGYIAALGSGGKGITDSQGAVTVDGANSLWTITGRCGAWLFIGGNETGVAGGTALLSVTNGGRVTISNLSAMPSVTVGISGTLTGNGTVTSEAGYMVTRVYGTLAPRSGTLFISGNLFLFGTASMACTVTPSGADNVDVSGTALLNGRLLVTMTGVFTPGTQFTLFHAAGGLTPNTTFSSYSITYTPDPRFTPVITYDANNVYLNLQSNE